ncbi:hypothetical protein VTL71DRAFT_11895 [Oculimacula yallundae]|uniref:Uncharacterized protein n=1 Tax=Oculimacula yallundae TaxID=86028 RepID=A0ABR4CS07_9HELO
MEHQGTSKQFPLSKEAFLASLPEADLGSWTMEDHFINKVARAPFHRILTNPNRYSGPPGKEFSLFGVHYSLSDSELAWFVQIEKKNIIRSEYVLRDPKGDFVLRDELWARVDIDYPFHGFHEREWLVSELGQRGLSASSNGPLPKATYKRLKEFLEVTNKQKRPRTPGPFEEDSEDGISERVTAPVPRKAPAPRKSVTDVDVIGNLSKTPDDLREKVKSQHTRIDKLTESNKAKDVEISDLQRQLSDILKKDETAESRRKKSKKLEDQVTNLQSCLDKAHEDVNMAEQDRLTAERRADRAEAEEDKLQLEVRSLQDMIAIYKSAHQKVVKLERKNTS